MKGFMSRWPAVLAWSLVAILVSMISVPAFAERLEVYADQYVVELKQSQNSAAALSVPTVRSGNAKDTRYALQSLGGASALVRPAVAAAAYSAGALSVPVAHVEAYSVQHERACEALLRANKDLIKSCSPNFVVHATEVPNDPQLSALWGLAGAYGIDAPRAWDVSTGSTEPVVAIIDTGMDYNHPELAANVWTNPGEIPGNGIDDDGDGIVDDIHGANFSGNGYALGDPYDDNSHGTHVAGTIGAVGNNGAGVVGVNWHARILPVKFLGAGGGGATSDAVRAVNYLITLKQHGVNIRVVNNSWGGGGFSQPLYDAFRNASDLGMIFTVAAGNSGVDIDASPSYPASFDISTMVRVAAIDSDGNLASFSNYGASGVDIAAPGVGILSTIPLAKGSYATYSGTSMATPHVSGALTLLLAAQPTLSAVQARTLLLESGRTLPTLAGVVASGRTLNVGNALLGITEPLPDPAQPVCPYDLREIDESPATDADKGATIISQDEDGFATVSLPFNFPFKGNNYRSMVLSPNGVVYFGGAPTSWDNHNAGSAPRNSIAALHTDLIPDSTYGSGLGVRVAKTSKGVVVSWKAKQWDLRDNGDTVTVRLLLAQSGRIKAWYTLNGSSITAKLRTATIGIKGDSEASATTYNGSVHNGLALMYVPNCGGSVDPTPAPDGTHIQVSKLRGVNSVGAPVTRLRPGGLFKLDADVNGSGSVSIVFHVDGKRCSETVNTQVNDGAMTLMGRLPAGINGKILSASVVGGDRKSKTARAKIAVSSSQLRTRSVSTVCSEIIDSLR